MPTFAELYDKARRAFEDGSPDHALVPATEAVKLEPERLDGRLLLARVWLAQRGYARAIAEARLVLERVTDESSPDFAAAHEVIAGAALALPDPETAERSLTLLARDRSNVAAAVRLVAFLLRAGRIDEAKARAEELAAAGGPTAAAAAALGTVLDARPEDNADLLALADLETSASLLEEARAHYQQVLSREPTNERAADGFRRASGQRVAARPAPAGGQGSRLLAFLPTMLLSLGGAMLLFSKLRRDQIEAFYPDAARLFMAVGGGIVVGSVALEVWLRIVRRRAAPGKAS